MDTEWIAVLGGLVGVAVGFGGAVAFRISEAGASGGDGSEEAGLPKGAAAVLTVMGQATVVVDGTNDVERASPHAYAYGLVRGHSLVVPEVADLVARVRTGGSVQEQEIRVPRLDGEEAVLHVRVAPLDVDFVVVAAEDRTEAKRMENVRNDFVANVSHELKTPVGALSLLAEAVEEAAEEPEAVRRFAARMRQEATRLAHLVQGIIQLSRLETVDLARESETAQVVDVVRAAVDQCSSLAEQRQVVVSTGEIPPALVAGDRELLSMAVRNLVENAIRHSPRAAEVGVGVRRADSLVLISVTDRGAGIPPEEQDRIFERFYRIDPARQRTEDSPGGNGLGLSIVKRVVSQAGGGVSVWSRPGQGSTFTIRLPEAVEED